MFSESLSLFRVSLFRVLSPSFIFTWTALTNNAFEICKNASHCCAWKYETWRQYPLSQNISITLLQILLKLHEHRSGYWRKKLPWTILEEQFPVPRYTAASKIGNSVISLLWQLRCRCNPDRNKFSSLSNTTAVAIFPNLCLWRPSLRSNFVGIDPEKLYRATLRQLNIATMHFFLDKQNREFGSQTIQMHCFESENQTYTGTWFFGVESWKSLKGQVERSWTENPCRKRPIFVMENFFCRKVRDSKHQRNDF